MKKPLRLLCTTVIALAITNILKAETETTTTAASQETNNRLNSAELGVLVDKPNKHEFVLSSSRASYSSSEFSKGFGVDINYAVELSKLFQLGVLVGYSESDNKNSNVKTSTTRIGVGPTVNFFGESLNNSAFFDLRYLTDTTKDSGRGSSMSTDDENYVMLSLGKRFALSSWASYRPRLNYFIETYDSDGSKEEPSFVIEAISFSIVY